ncbi:MarR family transcriptional regulator [Agromyces sp. H66]|uniref:MarR family winged helix-turn-helix transcriptional regulator n=1 Tax=Agromyces sp. H66 TaxID=2529859 RepID=UPI0010AB0348|nr:MarR family transcriptional regulator [Agromyces sp. H66]
MLNPTESLATAPMLSGSERLWATSVVRDLAFLLARANALSLAQANAAAATHGLKVRSYTVLAIAVSDTRPTQRELAEFLRLDPSQIVALVDELESRALVRREPDPSDRRANVVVATDEGRATYASAHATVADSERAIFAALSAEERTTLMEMLRRLAGAPDALSA